MSGDVGQVAFLDEGVELGTAWSAVVFAPADREPAARRALAAARAVVREHEARLSEWRLDSHISDVNRRAAREVVPLEPSLRVILAGALHVARATDGAFDVTWRSLAGVWEDAVLRGAPPTEGELALALAAVGSRHLALGPDGVRLGHPETRLGIAGIAKGWIIDQAFFALRRAGFADVVVNIGGDLRTSGRGVDGRPHTIRVADPFDGTPAPGGPGGMDKSLDEHGAARIDKALDQPATAPSDLHGGRPVAAAFELENAAVATTGNYLRSWQVGAERFGHNLDPRTGRPPAFDGSVTVVTRDAAMADALATALFVMGPDEGLAFAARTPGLECLYLTRRGARPSEGLAGRR